jgi:hypothetical protein
MVSVAAKGCHQRAPGVFPAKWLLSGECVIEYSQTAIHPNLCTDHVRLISGSSFDTFLQGLLPILP